MIIKKGIISSGPYQNWEIYIEADTDGETGGYYLYIKNNLGGYDYWFINAEQLERQLEDLEINWFSDEI